MRFTLLHLVDVFVVLFSILGFAVIVAASSGQDRWRSRLLFTLTLVGPATLGLYWWAQNLFLTEQTLVWSRLMAGDMKTLLSFASLGLIVGSALALGALSLGNRFLEVCFGAVCVASMWVVVYYHPTPHYVPMPEWADNLVWFVLLVGGSLFCVLVYLYARPWLERLKTPASILAGCFAIPSILLLMANIQAQRPMALAPLPAEQRIKAPGCLACHTMGGVGREEPGGGLESVASRNEDVLLAFLLEPTAEMARELGIREAPTGGMAGYQLTRGDAELLVEAFKELFEVQPPTTFGPGNEDIEAIVMENSCIACHSVRGEGAPDGGLGGPFENAAKFDRETLVAWLMEPTEENAVKLGIRPEGEVMGAMTAFPLPEDKAERMADWLLTLEPPEGES